MDLLELTNFAVEYRDWEPHKDDAGGTWGGEECPERIVRALRLYVREGTPCGGFLNAVLSNDLGEAVARADETNITKLRPIVGYVFNVLPSFCHGNPEKVSAWMKAHLKSRGGSQ